MRGSLQFFAWVLLHIAATTSPPGEPGKASIRLSVRL